MVAFKRITRFCARLNAKWEAVVVILTAWEKEMAKELDFELEVENLRRVKVNMEQACIDVIVPAVVEGLVGSKAFAMEWVEVRPPTRARARGARRLARRPAGGWWHHSSATRVIYCLVFIFVLMLFH
jgi:hypothetical protein